MNPTDRIERTIERLHLTTRAETDKRILDDAFTALEKSAQKQPPHVGRSAGRRTLRIRIAELTAIAAVILVAFALFFGTRATKAVTLSEIYEALGKVENVCIADFQAPANEPTQTEWISQTMNIDVIRSGERFVLWDIPNKVQMIKYLSSDAVQTEAISEEMLAKVEQAAGRRFGLVPFSDISHISGAQWIRVEDLQIETTMSGTKVYDLTWTERNTTFGAIRLRKWRVFVDAGTKLPERVEWYSKFEPEGEYKFETFSVVTYPNESQIKVLIRNAFGSALRQPGDPEYIGTPQPD
jgi:hypothetical protein